MNRSTSPRRSPDDVPSEEIANRVVQGVALVDADRAAAYAGLGTLRTIRAASLNREERLLARKFGDEHPRVIAIAQLRSANAVVLRDLTVAHALATTPPPVVATDGYVFHGFVRDRQRQPLARLTVALYDEKGTWISELGYGCSDERGYFILEYRRTQKKEAAASEPPEAETYMRAASASRGSTGATAEVRVYSADQKEIHREDEPLQLRLGAIDYREIIIGESNVCTPPPGAPNQPPPPPAPKDKPDTGRPHRGSGTATTSPLENIKGIGPARAAALRKMGITDVETLLNTPTEKLVGLAGFDAEVVKREARKALHDVEKRPPN